MSPAVELVPLALADDRVPSLLTALGDPFVQFLALANVVLVALIIVSAWGVKR